MPNQAARATNIHSILVQRFILTYHHNRSFLEAPASLTFPRGRCTGCRGTCLRIIGDVEWRYTSIRQDTDVEYQQERKRERTSKKRARTRNKRKNECKRFEKGPEICYKQLLWEITFVWEVKSQSFGPIQPESWSGRPEACWSAERGVPVMVKKHLAYPFVDFCKNSLVTFPMTLLRLSAFGVLE